MKSKREFSSQSSLRGGACIIRLTNREPMDRAELKVISLSQSNGVMPMLTRLLNGGSSMPRPPAGVALIASQQNKQLTARCPGSAASCDDLATIIESPEQLSLVTSKERVNQPYLVSGA